MTSSKKTVQDQMDREIASLNAKIRDWAEKAPQLRDETEQLLAKIRVARGTRDVAPRPSTTYSVGDEGPTPELLGAVLRLCVEAPRRRHDLTDMTGARETRVSGVLKRLQEDGLVRNAGDAQRAIWTATAKGKSKHRSSVTGGPRKT